MATKSSIEWTESTWNPVSGCSKISPGCKNCYAERMAKRLQAMGQKSYRNGFEVTIQEHVLEAPLKWKKPQIIFVNSMSDLFHDKVPIAYIKRVFEVMNKSVQHQFQVLTKRPERLVKIEKELNWTENIWMGVSVESKEYKSRITKLRNSKAHIKFLSLEPLLGNLGKLQLRNIDWVIVGGESGPKARPIKEDWVLEIKNQCQEQCVPFFFKQWGGTNKKKTGRLLQGRTWDELPVEKENLYVA